MVEPTVYDTVKKETTTDTRFFISSLPVAPKLALEAIRSHWGIESMHWTLDMNFDTESSSDSCSNSPHSAAARQRGVQIEPARARCPRI